MIETTRNWTGKDVLALRKRHKLTQQELADLLRLARKQTVTDWEGKEDDPIPGPPSVALTYIELDLDRRLIVRKPRS